MAILNPDSRLSAQPGCRLASYVQVIFPYQAAHQQREAQVMLVPIINTTEGLVG